MEILVSTHGASATARRPTTWFVDGVLTGLLLLPATWLVLFWSLVVHARLVVGEWPHARSGNPFAGNQVFSSIDPKELGAHADAVWLGMFPASLAIAAGILVILCTVPWRRTRPRPWIATAFFVASAACVATAMFDIGGFWNWFLD